MKTKPLIECTLDMSKPAAELNELITVVCNMLPSMKHEILRELDIEVGRMLAEAGE
ncbi:hypothetical protein [Paenibacillus taiwanensis]|uniref:hypothetical protein n=1 Tax=Paenibacillus taiwanensis TaxID=401638 RepID=UPI000410BB88|nr:hypothetical protein [Paenibacillus taiwanensis]